MTTVTLKKNGPRRVSMHGLKFERLVPINDVDPNIAFALMGDPRFDVEGLDASYRPDPSTPPTGTLRLRAIKDAIDDVEAEDENFEENGLPKAEVLSRILGYDVTLEEVIEAITGQRPAGSREPGEQVHKKGMQQVERQKPATVPKQNAAGETEKKIAAPKSPAAKSNATKKAAAAAKADKPVGKLTITRKPKSSESGDLAAGDLPNGGGAGNAPLLDTGSSSMPQAPAPSPKDSESGNQPGTENPVEV